MAVIPDLTQRLSPAVASAGRDGEGAALAGQVEGPPSALGMRSMALQLRHPDRVTLEDVRP